ncbi:Methionine synthase vitamin-B12 independent [Heyndrickxia coagulans 2-6]|nr:Methionine synthase vitamin-B12 independent [Heyndrickxia coagulans 2-6]
MMTKTLTKAPYRADIVGSFLRPARLKKAREKFAAGTIPAEDLRSIEDEEIRRLVDKQIEAGLEAVTDGEFRRRFWHTDFMEHLNGVKGYVPNHGYRFVGIETEAYDVRVTGKVSFNPDHPHIKDFIALKEIAGDRAVAKMTIPSPNQFFNAGIRNEDIYPDLEEYANDIIQTYRDAIKAFYDAGCRYLQLDDVYLAGLCAPKLPFADSELERERLIDLALHVANSVLEGKPDDLTITTHLCRGNYQSKWAFEGPYDKIAPKIFANEKVDGFFLEYDDERSGGFEPLKYIPEGGPKVVLGIFTSKKGELEDKVLIKNRIREASRHVPLEQLCISTQCGFSSTHHGNLLTEEQQWDKVKYIVDTAKEIWG